MGKFTEWVTSKFQQPLSLLFFLLGSLLLLLGITTGLEVPLLKQLTPEVNYRWVSLGFGCGFVLLAILVYYVPQKPVTVVRPGQEGEVAADPKKRFSHLLQDTNFSPTQKHILTVMAETVPTGGLVSEQDIRRKLREKIDRLKQSSDAEVYYRLEQLYWMGFLKKQTISPASNLYSLSEGFRQYLGL